MVKSWVLLAYLRTLAFGWFYPNSIHQWLDQSRLLDAKLLTVGLLSCCQEASLVFLHRKYL